MNASVPRVPYDKEKLRVAAVSAIHTWAGGEGELSREMLLPNFALTEEFLRRWLGRWMLARANPKNLRPKLAAQLRDVVRPTLMRSADKELPALISHFAGVLQKADATRGRQTSLVSKFAFSLRPEIIVPYDKRARDGLNDLFGQRIQDHDYTSYLAAFDTVFSEVAKFLDDSGLPDQLRPKWEPVMSERLFKLRTTDKYFMLLGGFPIERMTRD